MKSGAVTAKRYAVAGALFSLQYIAVVMALVY